MESFLLNSDKTEIPLNDYDVYEVKALLQGKDNNRKEFTFIYITKEIKDIRYMRNPFFLLGIKKLNALAVIKDEREKLTEYLYQVAPRSFKTS